MRIVLTLLLAAAALQDPIGRAQDRDMLVAFRFDTQHVVATVKSELTVSLPQLARDPVPQPLAKYGYPIFDLPPDLQKLVPSRIRSGDRGGRCLPPRSGCAQTQEKSSGKTRESPRGSVRASSGAA